MVFPRKEVAGKSQKAEAAFRALLQQLLLMLLQVDRHFLRDCFYLALLLSSDLDITNVTQPNIVVLVSQKLTFHREYLDTPNLLEIVTHFEALFVTVLLVLFAHQ